MLALRRRAFLAAPESNPTRQVGQAESTCPHGAKSSLRPPRVSRPNLFIVTIPRSTSGFSQSRVQQGRQVWHMREIMRPLGPTIEKQGRKTGPHGTAHVVFQVVADTEDLPGR